MDLFGTAGIRGDVRSFCTPELALEVGRAAARDAERVVLGRDGRTSGEGLAAAVESGLVSGGADVVRVGQLPTPALAFASRGRHGVMLTASHNPPHDNGIKLFVDGEEYDGEREVAIERRVETDPDPVAWGEWGSTRRADVLGDYRKAVVDYARERGEPLDGLAVAVDCGNGMGSLATPQVLSTLGASVRALEANVDGHVPARRSKPTPESLQQLRSFVADGAAQLGFGHDGDADRIVLVDSNGEVVHEDTVVAILAEHYVRTARVGDPVVVTTPNASGRIDERVAAAGGRVERVKLGYLHEGIANAREGTGPETRVVFAAEPWKHVHTAFGGWIDGVASAAVLSRLVADAGLDTLRAPVSELPYRKESVDCPDHAKPAAMAAIGDRLPETFPDADVETEYGVRLTLPDGSWALVRPSGTEPYVRIYAESDDVDELIATVRDVVEAAVADVR